MKRYSLKSLFALTTALILSLGYSQWRRQNILREVRELKSLGGMIDVPNSFRDLLWQRRPTQGRVYIFISDTPYDRGTEAAERMRARGLKVDENWCW